MKRIVFILFLCICSTLNLLAQTGIVKGKVVDAISNQPIPFSTVYVNGTTTGATADVDGNFVINGLNPGFAQVVASSVGYEKTLSNEVMISNSNPTFVEIVLQPTKVNLNEIVVATSQFQHKQESPLSMKTIGLSDIENNPGSNRDVSKVIQSFPGVGITPVFRNDLVIRGGGPNECKFYLDEVEIPNLNHFATQGSSGGAVGIINADFIKSVNYYSGAFPSTRGNALSGVFDFYQIEGNQESWKVRGVVGASELSVTVDGPTSKKSTLIFSVRRSYLKFLFSLIGLPFLPTFTDYQLKERIHFNDKNELTIVSIGALDQFKLNTGIKNPDEQQQYILSYLPVNEQWNYAIGGVYKHYSKKNYQQLVLSRNMLNNNSYKYPDNNESLAKSLDYQSQEIENKIRIEQNAFKGNHKTTYGFSGEYAEYNNHTIQQIFANNQLLTVKYNSAFDMFKYGLNGQFSTATENKKFNLSIGFRMDGNNYSSYMSNLLNQFSPRLSSSYALTKKIDATLNIGRYFELPAYTILGYRNALGDLVNKNNSAKYIQADHFIAGVRVEPNDNSLITIEGFYKLYSNYPFSVLDSICLVNKGGDFGTVGNEEIRSISKGRAYGAELLLRRQIMKNYTFLLSYTFVRSEFRDKKDQWTPTSWDSRNIVTMSASKQFKRNWNLGLKWRYSGGLPYTPYDLVTSSDVSAWNTQGRPFSDYNALNTARLKPFHQLDLRVDKKFFYKKWTFGLYLDIQNAYNYKTQLPDIVIREIGTDGNPVYLDPPQNTKYSLKNLPYETGTILPTIGLMLQF